MNSGQTGARWYRAQPVWLFIALRYAPLLAVLNLAWEIAQLPLYTIWHEAAGPDIAFAVAHCTAGDVLIGSFALVLALTVTRAGPLLPVWPAARIAAVTVALSVSYTIFSEWMNTSLLQAWAYSDLMPRLPGLGTGVSPLLQWIVIPPVALYLGLQLTGTRRENRFYRNH